MATLVIFEFSYHFNNASFYAAYWSVIPPPLTLFWMLTGPQSRDKRGWLVLALISFWSLLVDFFGIHLLPTLLMAAMLRFISIPMMGQRCSERRSGYAQHIRRVPALFPLPPRWQANGLHRQ